MLCGVLFMDSFMLSGGAPSIATVIYSTLKPVKIWEEVAEIPGVYWNIAVTLRPRLPFLKSSTVDNRPRDIAHLSSLSAWFCSYNALFFRRRSLSVEPRLSA